MMAVSVWDHAPDAEALLTMRVNQGWQPKTTATRYGELILGHACTRFGKCPPPGVVLD
ncbi:MAG: hypothetical protein ACPG77_16290 [Nannocystaceae bacterium]